LFPAQNKNQDLLMTTSPLSKWKLVKDIAKELCKKNNGKITIDDVKIKFEELYPLKTSSDIGDDIRMMTINSQSRLSHLRIYGKPSTKSKLRNPNVKNSINEYPQISDPNNARDVLFYLEDHKIFEIYEPSKHGVWEIVLNVKNVNTITKC
jgi:hypothetical protein